MAFQMNLVAEKDLNNLIYLGYLSYLSTEHQQKGRGREGARDTLSASYTSCI